MKKVSYHAIDKCLAVLAFLLFCLFSYQVYCQIRYSMLSFAGAMNMQVPLNLIKDGRYATSYNGGAAFDPSVQSVPPLLFPAVPFFLLFGVSSFTAQLPNAIYMILVSLVICMYVSRLANRALGVLSIRLFMLTPCLLRVGFGGDCNYLELARLSVGD